MATDCGRIVEILCGLILFRLASASQKAAVSYLFGEKLFVLFILIAVSFPSYCFKALFLYDLKKSSVLIVFFVRA